MKRWVVRSNGTELSCELITAFVSSSFKLKLKNGRHEFMIQFRDRDFYLEAREGGWRQVKIYTIDKKVTKYGVARFTEY